MSCGLMTERMLAIPFTPLLSIGTLSMTINGSLLALRDEPPRMRTLDLAPGVPPSLVIATPATLPTSKSWALTTTPLFLLSGFKAATDPVRSFFLTTP